MQLIDRLVGGWPCLKLENPPVCHCVHGQPEDGCPLSLPCVSKASLPNRVRWRLVPGSVKHQQTNPATGTLRSGHLSGPSKVRGVADGSPKRHDPHCLHHILGLFCDHLSSRSIPCLFLLPQVEICSRMWCNLTAWEQLKGAMDSTL